MRRMLDRHSSFWLSFILIVAACRTAPKNPSDADTTPPVAKTVPKVFTEHGQERSDPYYWLKERENPEVAEYLHRELRARHFEPPEILRRKVRDGELGKKTGKGFYEWPPEPA